MRRASRKQTRLDFVWSAEYQHQVFHDVIRPVHSRRVTELSGAATEVPKMPEHVSVLAQDLTSRGLARIR